MVVKILQCLWRVNLAGRKGSVPRSEIWSPLRGVLESLGRPLEVSWRLEEASLALKSVIFKVTVSMLHRRALDLEQFSFRTSFGKCYGRVWDDLGSVLGVVWRGKSGDFVRTCLNNQVFRRWAFKTPPSPLARRLDRSPGELLSILRATSVDLELMSIFSQWTFLVFW